jgi:antitoxin (DNA-binding transcriptional repressor) of toxin-antitoxin stability system
MRIVVWDRRPGATLRLTAAYGYNGHMIKASVSGLKDSLSEYLRKVRAGQSVVIYDRNVPIARIERIESSGFEADRVVQLRAEGITRPPRKPLSARQLAAMLPVIPQRALVLEALLAERAEDR